MKKSTILIAAIMLVCFAAPALAVDWNFYGSARINTWYVSRDYDKGLNPAGTDTKDSEVRWGSNGHDNARFGARVKHENVSGRMEIQMKANAGGDDGVANVDSRLLYGVWDFGAGKLKVGKDYTPITQFVSGQAFDEDIGLLGRGTSYGNRTAGISLAFGGFEVALLEPKTDFIPGLGATTSTTQVGTGLLGLPIIVPFAVGNNGDVDSYIPKIEAKWGMAFDTWNFNIRGGYQYYSIEDVTTTPAPGVTKTEDVDVTSYALAADGGVNFGPGYVKAAISWSRNPGQAAWHLGGLVSPGNNGLAVWDGKDGTDDNDVLMGALVGGLKVSDMLSFEAGWGYRQDDLDVKGAKKDKVWELYVQSVIVMAPGVYVIPEIGYTDFMKNAADLDEGSRFYLGAKWQIDF